MLSAHALQFLMYNNLHLDAPHMFQKQIHYKCNSTFKMLRAPVVMATLSDTPTLMRQLENIKNEVSLFIQLNVTLSVNVTT